jgi:hypothetical protein
MNMAARRAFVGFDARTLERSQHQAATPPWREHVPLRCRLKLHVPSQSNKKAESLYQGPRF